MRFALSLTVLFALTWQLTSLRSDNSGTIKGWVTYGGAPWENVPYKLDERKASECKFILR